MPEAARVGETASPNETSVPGQVSTFYTKGTRRILAHCNRAGFPQASMSRWMCSNACAGQAPSMSYPSWCMTRMHKLQGLAAVCRPTICYSRSKGKKHAVAVVSQVVGRKCPDNQHRVSMSRRLPRGGPSGAGDAGGGGRSGRICSMSRHDNSGGSSAARASVRLLA